MDSVPAKPDADAASVSEDMQSDRARGLKVSPTIAMSQRAAEMRRTGIDVVNLSVGEPETPTPSHIIDAAHEAALAGQTRYTAPDGHQRVKQAVQTKLRRENGLEYELTEISVVSGCKQVLFNAMAATINPGDEVVIIAPYWVSYADMVTYHGGIPVIINTQQDNSFEPDPVKIENAITERTKWLFINSPNNPTGAVYSEDLLSEIGRICERHPHIMLLSDEIYEHLVYDNKRHLSVATALPHLRARILLVNGLSKAYSMTGWRVGYGAGPAWLIGAIARVQSQSAGSSNLPAQFAAVAALEGDQSSLAPNRDHLLLRRDLAMEILGTSDRMKIKPLSGTFYLYADISACMGTIAPDGTEILTDKHLSDHLLDTAHVATVPGVEFGCSPFIRLSYAVGLSDLGRACEAIVAACAALEPLGKKTNEQDT